LPTVIAGHELDARAILKVARGGTAESDAKDVAVKPAGEPSGSSVVTTATPAA
jgi:hypothetical protein